MAKGPRSQRAVSASKPPSGSAPLAYSEPLLVFALVRPIGIDVSVLSEALESALHDANFDVENVRLSSLLPRVPLFDAMGFRFREEPEDERYRCYMDAGDILRGATMRGDAVAVLAIEEVLRLRRERQEQAAQRKRRGLACILRSLMHPREVQTLRRVYGRQLFVISASAPAEEREVALARRLSMSRGGSENHWRPVAASLLNREQAILDPLTQATGSIATVVPKEFLLDVAGTFETADMFLSAVDPEQTRLQVRRLVELIFSQPFKTPTRDEFAMSVAFQASLRSAALTRQVGACAVNSDGDVLSVGCNEVPKFGGGLYWEGDQPDGRDFQRKQESNDAIKAEILSDLFERIFSDSSWLNQSGLSREEIASLRAIFKRMAIRDMGAAALKTTPIRESRLMDITEFGRVVHAEMAAVSDAARLGVSLSEGTLVCTTFPCHVCARHIVAAGIRRVVYFEPYPKSRVAQLHDDSIGLADRIQNVGERVAFEPYVGVAPKRYPDLFSWVRRRVPLGGSGKGGRAVKWSLANAPLRESIIDQESISTGSRERAIRRAEFYWISIFRRRLDEATRETKSLKAKAEAVSREEKRARTPRTTARRKSK